MRVAERDANKQRDAGAEADEFPSPQLNAQRRWTIRVDARLLSGADRVGLPSDLARALHCQPGRPTGVTVASPAGCTPMTVERQTSPDRTVISGLSDALWRLRVLPGELIDVSITPACQIAVQKADARLASNPERSVSTQGRSTPSRPAGARSENEDERRAHVGGLDPDVARQRSGTEGGSGKHAQSDHPLAQRSSLPSHAGEPTGWGRAPAPLLPSWYFETHGEEALPSDFTKAYPSAQRVKDLGDFWSHYSGPLDGDASLSLRDTAKQLMPPAQFRVLAPGFDLDTLDRLPLMNRTRNCVRRGLEKMELASGTVGELMSLSGFGITSLLDLMSVLETHVGRLPESMDTPCQVVAAAPEEAPLVEDKSVARRAIADNALLSGAVELIAAAARDYRGAVSVGDLLRLDLADLVNAAGIGAALDDVPLEASDAPLAARAVKAVEDCLGEMSDTQRRIALERTTAETPTTLDELAGSVGLSRERIRQLDRAARADLEAAAGAILGVLALVASERLGPVTTSREIETQAVELLQKPQDQPMSDASAASVRMLRMRLSYTCRNDLWLDKSAAKAARTLEAAAKDLADDEGLIDDAELMTVLASEWTGHLDALIHWLGWFRLSGRIALRERARARVKAALLKIGAPATKSEIAEECGLSERQVGGALSNIESVARADKTRWGLREWIDDVYEGIPAEIVQRINEDGGSTRLNRLLDELPRKFGVSEGSVWTYLNTPAFRVEHGWVSETTDAGIQLGRLDDIIGGRDEHGHPYWTFEVADRHLEGYSLQGIPPEIAAALGCHFGTKTTASVRSPEGCQDISVIWRKTSIHGPEIGRLGTALRAIGVQDGTAVSLIIHATGDVSFQVRRARCRPDNGPHTAANPDDDLRFPTFTGVRTGAALRASLNTQPRPDHRANHLTDTTKPPE